MKTYFVLQSKMLWRAMAGFGLSPWLGAPLLAILFLGVYLYLGQNTGQAHWIYTALGAANLTRLNSKERNEFLGRIFSNKQFRIVRLVEHLLAALPFLIMLALDQRPIAFGVLLLSAVLMRSFQLRGIGSGNGSIPTPYSQHPFEFAVGFRKTWALFPLVMFLIVIAGVVPNFGLGVLAMIVTTLMCMFYYTEPENEMYVWVYAQRPKGFLIRKIRTAVLYFTGTMLPQVIALIALFPERWWLFLSIGLLTEILMVSAVLARYSNYPHEMGVSQGILYALCAIFPPMLLVVIPYFYAHSVDSLKPYLK